MQFEGIYTPLITPFKADYSIDEANFVAVIDFLIEAGVQGLIVAGTTGEYYAQTAEERIALMSQAKAAIKGRVPLIVGTGALRTEDSITFAEAGKAAGADALLVATPPYSCPTGAEIAQHILAVERAGGLPVMLYNYPGRMSVSMDETTLDALAGNTNICAIKESSGSPDRLHLLARDYPQIQLSCGMDDQALEFFAWGARSWVCAGSNFAPEAHLALYRACALEKDFDKGRRIMSAMLPLMRVLEQGGTFVQCIKEGTRRRGIEAGSPRLPLQPLSAEEAEKLGSVITAMDAELAAIEAGQ
ncbi:MAG: dihydrodipicolinate synthase family protein [Pseudomonadota bacterium]